MVRFVMLGIIIAGIIATIGPIVALFVCTEPGMVEACFGLEERLR